MKLRAAHRRACAAVGLFSGDDVEKAIDDLEEITAMSSTPNKASANAQPSADSEAGGGTPSSSQPVASSSVHSLELQQLGAQIRGQT